MDISSPNFWDSDVFSGPPAKPNYFTDIYPFGGNNALASLAKDYIYDIFQLTPTKSDNRSHSTNEFDIVSDETVESDGKDDIIIGTGRGNPRDR